MNALLEDTPTNTASGPLWLRPMHCLDDAVGAYRERVRAMADLLINADEDGHADHTLRTAGSMLLDLTAELGEFVRDLDASTAPRHVEAAAAGEAPSDDDEGLRSAILAEQVATMTDMLSLFIEDHTEDRDEALLLSYVLTLRERAQEAQAEASRVRGLLERPPVAPIGNSGVAVKPALAVDDDTPTAPPAVPLGKHATSTDYANARETLTSAARALLLMHSCATQPEECSPSPEAAAEAIDCAHCLLSLAETIGQEEDAMRRMEVRA